MRSVDLEYAGEAFVAGDGVGAAGAHRAVSLLASATQCGYRRTKDGLLRRALPPLEFTYSPLSLHAAAETHTPGGAVARLPVDAPGATAVWADLDGEGVAGVLVPEPAGWYYAPNLGGGNFGAPRSVSSAPTLAAPGHGGQLLDLSGDGQLDLVSFRAPDSGFFERTIDGGWAPFRAFDQLPAIDWDSDRTRFIDLNGDGYTDILVADGEELTWYPSAGEAGFGPGVRVPTVLAEDRDSRLVRADGESAVFVADMSGDGLADLVRVRHNEVCYWPISAMVGSAHW